MNASAKRKLWDTREGKLYRLAERLEAVASDVRQAGKPHDLVFPTTTLVTLLNEIKAVQWDWVSERLGVSKKDRAAWRA